MAAVTQSNVTIVRAWTESNHTHKQIQAVRQLKIVLSAQGATTGDIPMALYNLSEVHEVYGATLDTAGTISAVPVVLDLNSSKKGIGILTCSPSTGALANATGTLYVTVKGRST